MTHLILSLALMISSTTATLTGRITDVAGTALTAVEVQAINVETGVSWTTFTNDEGFYIVGSLPPGMYRLMLQRQGFRTVVKPDLELRVQDIFALNFEMQIGAADTSVSEQGGTPLLQAETATLGQTISGRSLEELPVLTRDPYDFVLLLAGASAAVNVRSPGLNRNASPSRHGLDFAINGQREESVNFLLDGADGNSNPATTRPGQMIQAEAVREFRVLTNGFTAEYGRNSGFVANLVTKSGTNEWHGSLYNYVLNSTLAANTFDNNANRVSRPVFNRHQPGTSVGGPIVRDKAFFFAALESLFVRSWGETQYFVSPTPELLAISSPETQATFRKYPGATSLPIRSIVRSETVDPFGGGPPMTVPFIGRAHPTVPIDKGAGSPQDTYLGIGRADYAIGNRTILTGRYAHQRTDHLAFPIQQYTQQYAIETDQLPLIRNHNATISATRLWSTRLVTESRLTYSRLMARAVVESYLYSVDNSSMVRPSRTGGPRDLYQFRQTASWLWKDHHFRLGGDIIHYRDAIDVPRVVTVRARPQDIVDGIVDLSFDTDHLASGFQAPNRLSTPVLSPQRSWHLRYNELAFFFQDTWKVAHRLTLTPGLRWEYFGVQSSRGNEKFRDINFYPGQGATYFERFSNGRFLSPADAPPGYRNHAIRPDRNNIAPRLGLVLLLTGDGKTVFRAGGGIFFDTSFGRVPPSITGSFSVSAVPISLGVIENPYAVDPPLSTFPFLRLASVSPPLVRIVDPDRRTPYAGSWNATIEREIRGHMVLSAAYAGSSGSSLESLVIENFNDSARYLGKPGQRLLDDYANFETIKSLGHSSYHSLQFKAETKEIPGVGLRFGANYTWSHSIDNGSSRLDRASMGTLIDPWDLRLDRGNSGFDQRQRLVSYFSWQAPRLSTGGRFARRFFEGWRITGILSSQTGLPFLLVDGGLTIGAQVDGTPWGRPRVTGPLPKVLNSSQLVPIQATPNQFLYLPRNAIRNSLQGCIPDASPFACLDSLDEPFDNVLPRNHYRRPGTFSNDIALIREFRIGEKVRAHVRAEFYNLLNHPSLELVSDNGKVTLSGIGPGVRVRYGGPPRKVVLGAKLLF